MSARAPAARGQRIVIVGASLAGLRAAETLRREGFDGDLTIIGDEAEPPYDRPPLSKQVLMGCVPPDHTEPPHRGSHGDTNWSPGRRRPWTEAPKGSSWTTAPGSRTTWCSSRPACATGPGRTRSRPR